MADKHMILDCSKKARVFIAGDIHGEHQMLLDELARVDFDEDEDVLVLVGDICDRGPDSEAMIDFIAKPFVKRALGNHDVAPRLYLNGEVSRQLIEENFGGGWFTKLTKKEIEKIAATLEDAPVALTVITPGGKRIGVVHADCRPDWHQHVATLDVPWVYDLSLWKRDTIHTLMQKQQDKEPIEPGAVTVVNIDHVFHGHTPIAVPFTKDNRSWIDTGACFGGSLTMWDVDAFLTTKRKVT